MADKPVVSASKALADIRSGLSDTQIMAKYSLSGKGLNSLLTKLVAMNLISQEELDNRNNDTSKKQAQISAKTLVSEIKNGMSDIDLMTKYDLSPQRLNSVFAKLMKAGYIMQEDLAGRQGPARLEGTIDLSIESASAVDPERSSDTNTTRRAPKKTRQQSFELPEPILDESALQPEYQQKVHLDQSVHKTMKYTCPSCGLHHKTEFRICPQCGVTKERPLKRPHAQDDKPPSINEHKASTVTEHPAFADLMGGIRARNFHRVKDIIENGVFPFGRFDIDLQEPDGTTPLIAACQEGHYEVVKFLLQRGADATRKTIDGSDALSEAKARGHTAIVELLTSVTPKDGMMPRSSAGKKVSELWFDRELVVIILLIVFFPVGLYALCKSAKFQMKTKLILTVIILIVVFSFGGGKTSTIKKAVENRIISTSQTKAIEDIEFNIVEAHPPTGFLPIIKEFKPRSVYCVKCSYKEIWPDLDNPRGRKQDKKWFSSSSEQVVIIKQSGGIEILDFGFFREKAEREGKDLKALYDFKSGGKIRKEYDDIIGHTCPEGWRK